MSLPTALAAVAVGATVYGTYTQIRGAKKAAKSEAALYRYNAALDRREAQQRRTASLDEQNIRREQARQALKRQRAKIAKSRIQLSGSALIAQLESAKIMAADIATLAYGRELEAESLEERAKHTGRRATAALESGQLAAQTALVGGLSDISRLGVSYYLSKQPAAKHPAV